MKFSQLVKGAQDTVEKLFSPKKEKTVECAIDGETVPCDTLGDVFYSPEAQGTWTGIPAPAYLEDDPWFGPAPERTQKQLDYMEKETIAKQEEEEKRREYNGEPCSMHQLMYEMATSNWNTVKESQGGSENFQEGPGGWNSGNGWSINKQ